MQAKKKFQSLKWLHVLTWVYFTLAILASGADVLSLQELNPQVAGAIRDDLSAAYPYQQLDARDSVFGSGVISRYPLHLTGETLPGGWVGTPQILSLTVDGKSITLINAHVFASHPDTPELMETAIAERAPSTRKLARKMGFLTIGL